MASLNLNALKKNISESSQSTILKTDTPVCLKPEVPSLIHKISLTKLKKSSNIPFIYNETDSLHKDVCTNTVDTIIDVPVNTEIISQMENTPIEPEEEAVSIKDEAVSIKDEAVSIKDEAVFIKDNIIEKNTQETIFTTEQAVEENNEVAPAEVKEFFPNLTFIEKFSISDDLLVIKDMMSIKTEDAIPITSVQEVKNELSEQRTWGFRFFTKGHKSVIAGIGIITTFSLIGLFSGGFFSSTTIPTGKSNIKETIIQTPVSKTKISNTIPTTAEPSVIPETTETVPIIKENQSNPVLYEVGQDYFIIKNIKKNLKKQ